MADTQYSLPLIVTNFTDATARGLKRVRFVKGDGDGYQERWLQKLISRYPNVLPIQQIEPSFVPIIPICMELPLASGNVDNLYVTPDGDLIVGEAKLFRNPEARREVIGQIIDYAKDLSALSYEELDKAILGAEAPDGNGGHPKIPLYEVVVSTIGDAALDEEQFKDNVSRNLERGRFLLLIIGDGIQAGIERIAEFLQQHAGMHFTLGLIELAIFEFPKNLVSGYLVQPRVLARTKNIDRGIVTIENGRTKVNPPAIQAAAARRMTITEEKFYEKLGYTIPEVDSILKAFVEQLETIGVRTDFGTDSMILRWSPDDNRAWNLATITTSGKVWTEILNGQADSVGLISISHEYLNKLASSVPGAYVKDTLKATSRYVAKGNTYITIDQLLSHEDNWLKAIQEFIAAATDALTNQ